MDFYLWWIQSVLYYSAMRNKPNKKKNYPMSLTYEKWHWNWDCIVSMLFIFFFFFWKYVPSDLEDWYSKVLHPLAKPYIQLIEKKSNLQVGVFSFHLKIWITCVNVQGVNAHANAWV